MQREAVATVGAKYDFRAASLRAQADSTGKLSVLMEKRLLQAILVNFAGELDQLKQQAKVGVGVSIELPNEEVMEQQERAMSSNLPPPPY
ncbi:MAG: hypothetical protein LQ340_007882 [Diploschistes diacapsis]|nr:MAG: hypothetical protein LQ340_007882 [Diploschistes diacapsis]